MCCCGKPVINGTPGFRWTPDDSPGVHPVNAPELDENDTLVHDEPGRCGGIDAHCHHYRVVIRFGRLYLLVRYYGGSELLKLHSTQAFRETLDAMDSDARYWTLHAIYYANKDGERQAKDEANAKWQRAAAERRIKTRRNRGAGTVKVWIESPAAV